MSWVFWSGISIVVYTYVGYPVWLWLRTHWQHAPVIRARCTPPVSLVMVVRNEEKVLERKLRNLLSLNYPADNLEIVVVSDGSTDGTDEILAGFAGEPRLSWIRCPESRGKASGLNQAIAAAKGEVVVFTDARQQIEIDALGLLMENFADPTVGCASGE